MAKCRTCDGTGKTILMNSWFIQDGFRRETCGICGGAGVSSFPSSPDSSKIRRQLLALEVGLKAAKAGTGSRWDELYPQEQARLIRQHAGEAAAVAWAWGDERERREAGRRC